MGLESKSTHIYDSQEHMAEKLLARKVRQEGDRNAFEMLFRAYHSRLHGFAYTFVRQSETAEDIIQTIFLNIWADKENWNPPGTVREYLFAAVRNQSLNVLRHQKIVADSEEEIIRNFETMNSSDHLNEHIDYIKFNRQIQVGIEKLPTRCREIYLLNRRCGMTYTEISEYLGLSINTVNTQMGRALKSLRDHLSDFLPVFVAGISKLFL